MNESEYRDWLVALKTRYHAAQVRAAVAVNGALIEFYWSLGRDIEDRFDENGYGIAPCGLGEERRGGCGQMESAERNGRRMTQNRRIFLNIVATHPDRAVGDIDRAQPVRRSLYARTIGLFCGRRTLMTLDMPKLTMEAKFS